MHRILKPVVHVGFKVTLRKQRDGERETDALRSLLRPLPPAPRSSSGEGR